MSPLLTQTVGFLVSMDIMFLSGHYLDHKKDEFVLVSKL